ncbi:MAG: hypothetical protein JWR36_645 [Glaciihabitans sp.]|jgi:uncharacterized LabA/DUF88 family protein|nr:hypothetical protein [Glaciihabitans sp.]MDQ1572033.1 hypothetical protein [Actinomycetota bacterium]
MAEPTDTRVAVYIDFDNIVISRYDQIHGRGQFQKDRAHSSGVTRGKNAIEFAARADQAKVDVGAILDYASSFGTIVISRAYADWSAAINSDYRRQLVDRAIDLTQLFPVTASMKNGADIRLAVDVVEDLFRIADLTHVVIVAGDSDYIALAQRSKRLGRFVVGIGVAGSTSRALAAACDEFSDYDALPGVTSAVVVVPKLQAPVIEPVVAPARTNRRVSSTPKSAEPDDSAITDEDRQAVATDLLRRALRVGHAKDDQEWLFSASVKSQMQRMDPSFNEKALGFRSFSDFVNSRSDVAELDDNSPITARKVRLRPDAG